jgi:hypothetical protein
MGGNITRESMVWTEGMAEWLPAGQIEGLFPAEAAPVQGSAVSAAPDGAARAGAEDPCVCPDIKPVNCGLWIGLFPGGIAVAISGVLLIGAAASAAVAAQNAEGGANELTSAQVSGVGVGGTVVLAGCFLITLSFIPAFIALHRAWACLQPGGMARSTPGKAVGFLFIPFFNIYWLFQAYLGLAKDWNRTAGTYSSLKAAPKMSEGVFLIYSIVNFVFPLGPIMLFPVMSQRCKGVNFFAYRPKPGNPGALGGGSSLTFGGQPQVALGSMAATRIALREILDPGAKFR